MILSTCNEVLFQLVIPVFIECIVKQLQKYELKVTYWEKIK